MHQMQAALLVMQKTILRPACAQVPAGSLPRTMEVILRNDVVEQARAGDKLVFVGCLVVVPDVSVITAPGQRIFAKGARECPQCPCRMRAFLCPFFMRVLLCVRVACVLPYTFLKLTKACQVDTRKDAARCRQHSSMHAQMLWLLSGDPLRASSV